MLESYNFQIDSPYSYTLNEKAEIKANPKNELSVIFSGWLWGDFNLLFG